MGELFNRSFELNLGGTRVASQTIDGQPNQLLKCEFKIERDLGKSPNTAEVAVWNLAESTRAKVSQGDIETTLEAGYATNTSVIFRGKLEAGKSVRDGVNWVTSFQSTDGGKELRQGRINVSFKKVTARGAFERIAQSLGLALGNSIEKISEGNIRGALTQFGNGLVLSGSSRKELDRLATSLGYSWSVQNGQLQLLGPTDVIEPGDAIVLNKNTGMIGTPESGEKGIVEVRSLLIPQLEPGRVVILEAEALNGSYRVEKTVYQGDTRGKDWYADLELKPL